MSWIPVFTGMTAFLEFCNGLKKRKLDFLRVHQSLLIDKFISAALFISRRVVRFVCTKLTADRNRRASAPMRKASGVMPNSLYPIDGTVLRIAETIKPLCTIMSL